MPFDAVKINNNMLPQLDPAGQPTEYQIACEASVLFHELLKGWGVPYQLQRFCWAVYTSCKPGELYNWNDGHFAELLGRDGSTSKNYICKLRRALKIWQGQEYEDGAGPHPVIVQVTENEYNAKLKTQTPTGYTFSLEFQDHFQSISAKVRQSSYYKQNWIKAIRETLANNRRSLMKFGVWKERKQKRPRDPEKVAGTLWMMYERAAERLITFYSEQGFKAEWIAAEMQAKFPAMLKKQVAGAVLTFKPRINTWGPENMLISSIPAPGTFEDYKGFQRLVNAYIEMRMDNGENNDAGRYARSVAIEGQGRNRDKGEFVPAILDGSAVAESLQKVRDNGSMDLARKRFLQGVTKRE